MKKNMIKRFYAVLTVSILLGMAGCEDDTITPDPPVNNDTSQVNFNNLVISEGTILFQTTYSAVDLYKGVVVVDSNRLKDANLLTNFTIADTTYYFASGDIFDNVSSLLAGYQTKFRLMYANLTQAQFDTLQAIPITDSVLSENDFTLEGTQSVGIPLAVKPVYGFYLKGKYDNSYVPKQVFGIMLIDSTFKDAGGAKVRFDVKINKNAENKFRSQ